MSRGRGLPPTAAQSSHPTRLQSRPAGGRERLSEMVVRSSGGATTLMTVFGALVFPLSGCGVPTGQNIAGASSTLVNPLLGNTAAITAGCELYGAHCAHCHGASGRGNGEHSLGLMPPPADLVNAEALAKPDGHLFQRVWFGGQAPPYNSSMPAFSEVISHEQVWQSLAYVRALADGKTAVCADAEADHEHSHSPAAAAGSGAQQASAGTPAVGASAGAAGVSGSTGAGGPSVGAAGVPGQINAGGPSAVGSSAGAGGASSSMNTGGQTAGGPSAGRPSAGAMDHAGEGAAGAHEH